MKTHVHQMSQIYRSIAASTKTVSQALAIAGVTTLAIVIYTGFVSEYQLLCYPSTDLRKSPAL
jgi:hypothetical protein